MGETMNRKRYDVYIFSEAGAKCGFGHIVRCISLYDQLVIRGRLPLLIINSDSPITDIIDGRNYIIDQWYNIIDKYFINKVPQEGNSILSIVDSYIAEFETYKRIYELSDRALYIDDTNRIDYPSGIVVNPSLYGDKMSYNRTTGQTYLLGMDYIILRKEFIASDRYLIKNIKKDYEEILIIMGGSDVNDFTPDIIRRLAEDINYDHIVKHVVIGSGFSNIDEIKSAAINTNVQLHYNLGANKLKDLMSQCDIAISAAGQTVYELIAMKLPFVCVKVIDNQENNILGLVENGIIDGYADNIIKEYSKEKAIMQIIALLEKYKSISLRNKIIKNMESINIMEGSRNIINHFLG